MRVPRSRPFLVLVSLAAACLAAHVAVAAGQAPHDPWRTRETASFRVHYPAAWEAWAEHVAARLEPVRDVVADAVGYRPQAKVDVVLVDPIGRANGLALPFLAYPRMVLWATPPGAASPIGNYRDWTDLVVLHEDVHLVHLLRPSRNPWARRLDRLAGFGPLATSAPRWATEGYATLLEGRLTGAGRPNGDFRSAVLRARARAGTLPSYATLGAVGEGWQDASMAYLAGSAFLEWLERDAGPDALPALWRRMSARERRDFDAAFEGVFGDPPARAYERFAAETTWRAIEVERAVGDRAREGETVLDLAGATGAPAVSPDGSRVAVVVREPDRAPVLAVYALEPDGEAELQRSEAIAERLRRDPEDVAPVEPAVRPRERVHALPTRDGASPHGPRFLPGGQSILFHRFVPDGDGVLHADLYLWAPSTGDVRRVTRGADVRDADPSPDGRWAVAVRHRGQVPSLVRIDLADGAVATLVEGRVPEVFDRPRVSPDGTRVLFLRHRDGAWTLTVRDLRDGAETAVVLPDGAAVAQPSWHPDGRHVLATGGRDGFLDIVRIDLDDRGAAPLAITRSIDGAVAPEPLPSGDGVVFLGMTADGLEVRRAPLEAAPWAPAIAPRDVPLDPVVRPMPPTAPPRADPGVVENVAPARPYGQGRAEFRTLAAWNLAPSANQGIVGVRAGDVVGRWEANALGAFGSSESARGAALAGVWRGLPVAIGARAYVADERPSDQDLAEPSTGDALDLERAGVEVAVDGARVLGPALRGRAAVGGLLARAEPRSGGALDRRVVFAEAALAWRPSRGRSWLRIDAAGRADLGRTAGNDWRRTAADLGIAAGHGVVGLFARGRTAEVTDAVDAVDRFALGGTDGALLPSAETASRVVVPALPAGTRLGDRYRGARFGIEATGVVASALYWETHRVRANGAPEEGAVDLVGLEWTVAVDPQPLARLPATTIRFGVAHVLEDPRGALEGRTRAWITAAFRP